MEAGSGRVHQRSSGPVAGRSDRSRRWPHTYPQERVHVHNQQLRIKVKFHCCRVGIDPFQIAYYYSFGLELDRHIRTYGGGELSYRIAERLVSKWTEFGLRPDLLRVLVYQLTNVRLAGVV